MGAERKIVQNDVFRGKRHDKKILKVKILVSRNSVVVAQAPTTFAQRSAQDRIEKEVVASSRPTPSSKSRHGCGERRCKATCHLPAALSH